MLKIPGFKGLPLAMDMAGNSSNTPVLFFHGGGQTRHAWGEALGVLAEKDYFAVTTDLRGHGDSGWAEDGDYALGSFAADVTVLSSYFSDKPVLVGASLGGLASLLATGKSYGSIARGLILVDIVPRVNLEGAETVMGFMTANPDGFSTLEEAADVISAYIPHRKRPDDLSGLRKNLRLHDNGRYYWHWDPALFNQEDNGTSLEELERVCANIDIPVLLVRGDKSNIVDDEGVAHFREIIPHVEYIEVAGAAHMVAGDSNQQFNQAVLDFLKSVQA